MPTLCYFLSSSVAGIIPDTNCHHESEALVQLEWRRRRRLAHRPGRRSGIVLIRRANDEHDEARRRTSTSRIAFSHYRRRRCGPQSSAASHQLTRRPQWFPRLLLPASHLGQQGRRSWWWWAQTSPLVAGQHTVARKNPNAPQARDCIPPSPQPSDRLLSAVLRALVGRHRKVLHDDRRQWQWWSERVSVGGSRIVVHARRCEHRDVQGVVE